MTLASDTALADVLAWAYDRISRRSTSLVGVAYDSKTVMAEGDADLRRILTRAQLLTADGISVVWAWRILGTPLLDHRRMQAAGLEWLVHLLSEPCLLWNRFVVGNTRIAWPVLRHWPD